MYVSEKDLKRVSPPSEEELDMLDLGKLVVLLCKEKKEKNWMDPSTVAFEVGDSSRLACQITLAPSIDGIEVEVSKASCFSFVYSLFVL